MTPSTICYSLDHDVSRRRSRRCGRSRANWRTADARELPAGSAAALPGCRARIRAERHDVPGRAGRSRAGEPVEPHLPSQRRHAGHRTAGPPSHRPQRHARSPADCRRSRSLGDGAGRTARGACRTRASARTGCCISPIRSRARRARRRRCCAGGSMARRCSETKDLFVADNCNTGNPHFGSKLAFGPDGSLYMTIGERGDRNRAQNTAIHGGKILRLTEDGAAGAGQSVPRQGRLQARDLHLRQPEPAGARDSSGDRRRVGERTRAAGRRRTEHPAGRKELRLARGVVRPRIRARTARSSARIPRKKGSRSRSSRGFPRSGSRA